MKRLVTPITVMALALLASAMQSQAAPVTIFDDALQNGFKLTSSTRETVDTTMAQQGTASVKLSPNGKYDQLGFTSGPAIPADATTLQLAIYVDTTNTSTPISALIVQLATGNYPSIRFTNANGVNSTTPLWTIDGAPGTVNFSRGQWHIIQLDVAGAFAGQTGSNAFVPGTTHLASVNVQSNGDTTQSIIHLDSAAFVPEPASLTLWGLGMLMGLKRRRRRVQQLK